MSGLARVGAHVMRGRGGNTLLHWLITSVMEAMQSLKVFKAVAEQLLFECIHEKL